MTGVAATTLPYETESVEGVSRVSDHAQPRLRLRLASPRETSAATNAYAARLFDSHFAKLLAIRNEPSLCPDGAEKPSEGAIAWASAMLEQLLVDEIPPTRLVASAEGGVAICFVNGDKYADVEFLNTGEILGVVSNRRDRPVAWEVGANSSGMAGASARIRDFIYAPTPAPNDSRRARSRRPIFSKSSSV
jgi:hypothetical protein